jgi:hypothetical protein
MKNKRFAPRDGSAQRVQEDRQRSRRKRRQVHRARAELDQDGSHASDRVLQEHQGPQLLKTTLLAPMTLADVKKITDFERTQCGIKFST